MRFPLFISVLKLFTITKIFNSIGLVFLLLPSTIFGQTDMNSGFGNLSNSQFEISFSAGIFTGNVINTADNYLIHGVQQPVVDLNSRVSKDIFLELSIFPNPIIDQISISNSSLKNLNCSVYSDIGVLVETFPVFPGNHHYNLKNLSAGIYIFSITDNNGLKKNYKIYKKD